VLRLKKTAKNIFVLFSGDIGGRIVGFVASAYLARILGASNFGIVSIGLAYLTYALTVSSNGLPILGVRKIIESSDEKFVNNYVSARLVFAFIVILLTIIISFFIRSSSTSSIILAYSLYLIPSAFLLDWYFQAKEKMGALVSGRLLGMVVYLVLVLILVRTEGDVLRVAQSWFWGGVVSAVFFILLYSKLGIRLKIHISFSKIKSLFFEAFPLGIANIISELTIAFPPIFLGLVMTSRDVGYYSAGVKLVALFLILDRVFCISFFPAITRCVKETPNMLNQIFRQTLKWIVVTAILVGFLGILFAEPLIIFIFGAEYQASIPVFQMSMSYFILTLINSVLTFTLIALKEEKTYTISLGVGAVIFLFLSYFLVKAFGPAGMGLGLGIFQLAGLFIMANKLRKFLEIRLWRTIIMPILVFCAIFLPIMFLTEWMIVYKVLALLAGFLILPFLVGINKKDILFLKEKFI
jgi:O-antigen/teichoic acid export membrane protein